MMFKDANAVTITDCAFRIAPLLKAINRSISKIPLLNIKYEN